MLQSFSVAQIGARMHYAVPRILQGAGMLECLFTDISADHGLSRIARKTPLVQSQFLSRLRGRHVPDVPLDKITAFEWLGYRYAWKLRSANSEDDRTKAFLWVAKEFSKQIVRRGFGKAEAIYAFNGAAHGLFEHAERQGLTRVLEQTIAPKRIELEILAEAPEDFVGATRANSRLMTEFIRQEESEWQLADSILCASEFVKDGLIKCGISPAKCAVVPYGVDLADYGAGQARRFAEHQGGAVNVLFVGAVGSRKGVWTLFSAMDLLRGLNVQCRVVGPVIADASRLSQACPANATIVGPLPRSLLQREFAQADIFCLPSLCEGSATVIYEALASGLPVVTTNNAGSIVQNGIDGIIVPHSSEVALANAIERLVQDSEFRVRLGRKALERSLFGSLEAYSDRLVSALSRIAPR